jgi:hypothetical protein
LIGGLIRENPGAGMNGKNRIMIFGPKDDPLHRLKVIQPLSTPF